MIMAIKLEFSKLSWTPRMPEDAQERPLFVAIVQISDQGGIVKAEECESFDQAGNLKRKLQKG